MNPARHDRIGEVFLAARSLSGPEREAYLHRTCGGDSAFHAEVQSLLEADADGTGFLAKPTGLHDPARSWIDPTHRFVGKQIGRYTIRRMIGSGGMGTVYEAEQSHPRRTVALKMMRMGLDSPTAVRRFEYESHLLARLRHPAVAQVFDADVYADAPGGLPYFVMEHIPQAQPLTGYVRERGMGIRRRLELFGEVCEGVHHAHQNGVIHRDLKPENILVGPDGSPKIIDFGVARALGTELLTMTMHTTAGHLVGTLPYMSPEQAAGDPDRVDTRTDVYALGLILYQLLTGEFPYPATGSPAEVLDNIRHLEPRRPRSVDRRIDDEIETIVLKALQKDPDRRYQSAGELARDVRRHLAGEAIEAKRDSGWYILRKTVRRYRVQAMAAATLVALIAASAVALSFMYTAQRRERNRAERATLVAEERARDAEWRAYIASIAAANHAIADNDAGQALKCLGQAPERLRHWEWHHLLGRADLSLFTLPAPDRASRVAFSPDGARLAVGYWSGKVRVWDFSVGRFIWEQNAFSNPIHALAYVRDGAHLVVPVGENSWCVLDGATGEGVARFGPPGSTGNALAIDADNSRIAFEMCEDLTVPPYRRCKGIGIFDVTAQRLVREYPVADDSRGGCAVAFHPDGIATGDPAGILRIWDVDSGVPLRASEQRIGRTYGLAFSPDGRRLVSGHEDGTVALWDALTLREHRLLSGHSQRVWRVSFSPDGTRLASASQDRSVRIWIVADGSLEAVLRGHTGGVVDASFGPDGAQLATTDWDGEVKLWRMADSRDVVKRETAAAVESLAFDFTGDRVVTTPATTVWAVDAGASPLAIDVENSMAQCAVFGNNGELFVGSLDGSVRRLKGPTFAESNILGSQVVAVRGGDARGREVRGIALSQDGVHLATAGIDGHIVIWDAQSGQKRRILSAHGDQTGPAVVTLVFSPDGSRLASASAAGGVKLWSVATGEVLLTYGGHTSGVHGLSFSPDGTRVASASDDGTFRVWDSTTGETIRTVQGEMQDVWSIAYSPDGKRLVTGARDRTVRVWDAGTGDELLIMRGPTGTVLQVAWSPDGRRIAAGTWNRELFIWEPESAGGQRLPTSGH